MKKILRSVLEKGKFVSPFLFYSFVYNRAAQKLSSYNRFPSKVTTRNELFEDFLAGCQDKPKCLQIGVKETMGQKFGANWISVDKYDERDFIDYRYDIQDLQFEDNTFDAAVCWSILEHVPQPSQAISELHRVLKPGGEIWVQLPFLYPYHEDPKDYWRVTPDGLRIWMKDFKEISCGADFWAKTSLVSATYFYGSK